MAAPTRYYHISDGEDAILNTHTTEEIDSSIIVRDENEGCFYIFLSDSFVSAHLKLFNYISQLPYTPSLHEVCLPSRPQRLRIDLDIPLAELRKVQIELKPREQPLEYCDVCNYPIGSCDTCAALPPKSVPSSDDLRAQYVLDEVLTAYRRVCPNVNYVLCTSHGPEKYSYHIISYGYSPTSHHVHHICEKIKRQLYPNIAQFYDASVCSIGMHSLRLAGCIKPGSSRLKRVVRRRWYASPFDAFRDSLITYIGPMSQLLDSGVPVVVRSSSTSITINSVPDYVLKQLSPYHDGLTYIGMRNNMLLYSRTRPSFCPICHRQHDKDNTFWATAHGSCVIARCRHNDQKIVIR